MCCQAYYDLYPPKTQTAPCIQKLVDAGAVILGKTKMNSFGAWEEPTEYIDFHAPWNARADGYQSPAGSSTGSGAAVGAYEWIDIAIGTDSELHNSLIRRTIADTDSWRKSCETRLMERVFFHAPQHRFSVN